MKKLALLLIYGASRLPLRVLYALADVMYLIVHYLIQYRKKVITENLRNSFLELSAHDLRTVRRKFYHNFADYLAETLKSFTISSTELRVRVQHINQHLFLEAKEERKNIILLTGHVFNWEWFTALATVVPQSKCFPVYRKVNSSFWDRQILKMRSRFGNNALEANDVIKHIFRNENDGDSIYMFLADQSPHVNVVEYGLTFLNQATPVFIGYDKLATRRDLKFIYCDMKKVKRGYYQVNYYEIFPDGEKFRPMEVVKKFHQALEQTIRRRPDNYLWSHRKWKNADAIKHFES